VYNLGSDPKLYTAQAHAHRVGWMRVISGLKTLLETGWPMV
jgi:hypothetical protein